MTTIKTRLTDKYGVTHPFAGAGMAFAAGTADLPRAVAQAGGIGGFGVGFTPPELLKSIIADLIDTANGPFHINFLTPFANEDLIALAAEAGTPIVSFHWGLPPDAWVKRLKDAGTDVWCQVGTVSDGRSAADLGADVVVAQAWEAGGHNYQGMGAMALVPEMADALKGDALLLAAGGISDGRGVAAALSLGADGVWVGTRLVASEEANVHPDHHRRLVEAGGSDAVLSAIFGSEMPDFNPMRLLRNRVVDDWNDRLAEVPTARDDLEIIGETKLFGQPHVKRKFDVILPTDETTGDLEEMAWLAGQGVGLIRDVKPAGAIVEEMMTDAANVLRRTSAAIT